MVKRTGDGILVEFRSVVEAVRCAIEMQDAMVERNAGLPPERRIEFRVGIHLGDVVEEHDGDLMGDWVNIAARLEGVAKPGSICLSEDAYRQVRARLDLVVSDLGETRLKNIAEPIRIYSLQVGLPTHAKPATPVRAASEKPSELIALTQTAAHELWPRDVMRYFAAPLVVLLVAHHVIVNSFMDCVRTRAICLRLCALLAGLPWLRYRLCVRDRTGHCRRRRNDSRKA